MKLNIRKQTERGCTRFVLDYTPTGGKRIRRFYKTRQEAEAAMREKQEMSRRAGEAWLALSSSKRAELMVAHDRLIKAAPTYTMNQVLDEWLAGKSSRNGSAPAAEVMTLAKAGIEWEAHLRRKGNCESHCSNAGRWIRRFAKGRESMPVSKITTEDVLEYLDRYDNDTSWNNNRDSARNFFGLCYKRGWAPTQVCSSDAIPKRKIVKDDGATIMTPEQAEKALRFILETPDQLHQLAYVTIGLFCGCRPEEIDRLRWQDIDLDKGLIALKKWQTKTRRARMIHMTPTALAWVRLAKRLGSPLGAEFAKGKQKKLLPLRDHLGFDAWPTDIMRHSFGSYYLAQSHDLARTAAEMGNSPDIVMNHYHALVTPEQCAAYWALLPDQFNTQDPDLEAMDRQEND